MNTYIGILPDNRPKEEQEKNYDSRELDMGETKWLTKKEAVKNAKAYVSRNQYSKSSCVPSSICNALWNTERVVLSDEYLYSQRINKPQEGCYWYDIGNLVVNQGVCERSVMPEVRTETEANAIKITDDQRNNAKKAKQKSYLFIENPNTDTIAQWINSGIPVAFSFYSNSPEWAVEFPSVIDPKLIIEKAGINHAICAIPNTAYKEDGKKFFIITDSAHFGKIFIRHLSEGFTYDRAKHGMIFMDLEYEEKDDIPENVKGYHFVRDLTIGSIGNDVNKLQCYLQYKGFFPKNTAPTFYFGGLTRQAVKDYQQESASTILTPLGLAKGTGYFGEATRNFINHEING